MKDMPDKRQSPVKKAVGCFLEYDGRFLILQRALGQPQEGKWGLPAGGVEKGETEEEAVIREVREETGIPISSEKLEFLQEMAVDYSDRTIDFFTYRARLESKPEIILEAQTHQAFAWVTKEECRKRSDLIKGFREILEFDA
jgi:mutator protein MutT